MNFLKHSDLEGQHAFLGASKYHWINYDKDRLVESYSNYMAAQRGTELHAFAAQCIKLGQRLPKSHKTLNMYVNDAVGFRMSPEQVLYYSENCFGTADAISFRSSMLRIHDLKTGTIPAHMEQLYVYAALFFLEYREDPFKTPTELRIYQSDDIVVDNPDPHDIKDIMNKIVEFNKLIEALKKEGDG